MIKANDIISQQWTRRLRNMQYALIAWLIVSQLAVCWMERISIFSTRIELTVASLFLTAALMQLSTRLKNPMLIYCAAFLEFGLLIISALYGSTAGLELTWLTAVARLGLALGPVVYALTAIMSIAAFFAVSYVNHEMVVQASSHFVQSQGILGVIVGREFLTYLIGLLLVSLLILATRSEQANRQEAERLTEKLDFISKELERNRVAREIDERVDHLLIELSREAGALEQAENLQDPVYASRLKSAKDLAAESLQRVRDALQLLRVDQA